MFQRGNAASDAEAVTSSGILRGLAGVFVWIERVVLGRDEVWDG